MPIQTPNSKKFRKFLHTIEQNVTIGGEIHICGQGLIDSEHTIQKISIKKNGRKRCYIDPTSDQVTNLRKLLWFFIQTYPMVMITLKKPIHQPYLKRSQYDLEIRMIKVDMEYDFTWEFLPTEIIENIYKENSSNTIFCEQ